MKRTSFGRLRPLAAAMAYENKEVLLRFESYFELPRRQVNELWRECKRWLWVLAYADREKKAELLLLDERTYALDEMWHTFILFTKEYTAFCDDYLGVYVHHYPGSVTEYRAALKQWKRDPRGMAAKAAARDARMKAYLSAELGDAVVRRWFEEFPQRYPVQYINERRRFPG